MTVECETMVETATTLQAPESNQASAADDSSAKTIEFLRARLLSERAASKAARQQAQEIAEKVKDLNVRLEMEIKSRKEAESAMGKVFTILKAKGLALDALASTDLKDELEKGVSALDDVKEMNEDPHKEVLPKPLQNKDESAEKGTIEENRCSSREPYASNLENGMGIVCETDQTMGTQCEEALQQNATAGHRHGQVQSAVTDKPMVYTDNMSPKCPPSVAKDSHTTDAFDEGSAITLKLKAMLHQMEEEMAALPKEQQPLKLQLQSWVDHVAGVLDMEKESGLHADLHGSVNAGINYPLKEAEKVNVAVLNKGQDIPGGVDDTKEETGKTLSVVPKGMVQQANVMPPVGDYKGPYPSTIYPAPTRKDPALPSKAFHNRRSSYDAVHFSQQPLNMPVPPQTMQYSVSQPGMGHAPAFANSYTANGPPCYFEAQSPRSSDAFSLTDGTSTVGYRHRQLCETRSHGRGLGIERQAGYREDAIKCRSEMWSQAGFGSRDMLSSPYIVDVSDEVHMKKQDKNLNTQNIHLPRGHSYSHRMYMDQAKHAAELNTARPPHSFPVSDATLSLTDDRDGRLGDILMVLDVARQHVNEEEQSLYAEERLFGPPTPAVEEARFNRGCLYGDDTQQMPYEHVNHMQRSWAHSQAPIIQFPPSPASEHGYSPFERHGRHRRSSSVSANFIMSGWDGYLQPRGEVQLGNGITLYTD